MTSSLEITDQEAQAVAVAPRVTLQQINDKILEEYSFVATDALPLDVHPSLGILTIFIIVMKNGFVVIGKSAPASPENFNEELGVKFAREDCIRQIWQLEGYALREELSKK